MKKALCMCSMIVSSFLGAQTSPPFDPIQTTEEILEGLNYLTSIVQYPPDGKSAGLAYKGTAGDLNEKILPLTYYDSADYWNFVCDSEDVLGTKNNCHVTDIYRNGTPDYGVNPDPDCAPDKIPCLGGPANLQYERVDVHYGTSIYDAAVWQIALAVAGQQGLTLPGVNFFDIAQNQNILLKVGYDGNADKHDVGHQVNRAITLNGTFTYNGMSITTPENAYFFRYITRNWLSTDTFYGTSYLNEYVQAKDLPPPSPDTARYVLGNISWGDWKPITGENVWAFFIGPLQTAYLKQLADGTNHIPFPVNESDPEGYAIRNALNVLFAVRCMQSPIGAIYYACKGSYGNQGDQLVNPHEVAVENNVSALAGLMILNNILQAQRTYNQDLNDDQKTEVCNAINAINVLVHGGTTPQGQQTAGLLSFLKNYAWWKEEGIFYQGGLANDPGAQDTTWTPNTAEKAVDVTTWGISVLGPELIDSWFKTPSVQMPAYQAWQKVKKFGGFYVGTDLWGVGFSDKDQNKVNSAEWTAGAINLVRILSNHYKIPPVGASTCMRRAASAMAATLENDLKTMNNVLSLRSDLYPLTDAYISERPPNWQDYFPATPGKLAFLYSNKRYFIPFGWWANPLPNTTSTSWMILLQYNYNPFMYGGGYFVPAAYFDGITTCSPSA